MHVCAAGTLCLTACVTLHMLRAVCFVWQGDKRIPRQGIVREEGREKSGYMKAWNGTLAGLPIVSSGISVLIIIILLPGIFFFQSSICLSSSKFLFAILLFCSLFLPLSFFLFPSPLVWQWHWAKVGQSVGGQWGRRDRETARQGGRESCCSAVVPPPPPSTYLGHSWPLRPPHDVWGTRF